MECIVQNQQLLFLAYYRNKVSATYFHVQIGGLIDESQKLVPFLESEWKTKLFDTFKLCAHLPQMMVNILKHVKFTVA